MADFAKFFHKTPEIFTLKASRYGNFCGGSCSQANVHRLRRQALQAHSRELRRSQPLQNSRCRESITFPIRKFFRSDVECIDSVGAVGAVLHNIGCTRHSRNKFRSALVGTIFRGGLLPIRQVFRCLCLCGTHCGRGSRRLPSDSGEILSFCDSARKSLIS